MKLKKIAFMLMILCDILICMSVYSDTVTTNLSDNLLRLHIIAEDNQKVNQEIKLAVRDIIIEQINNRKFSDKYEVVSSLGEVEKSVNDYLERNNTDYNCKVFFSKSDFPTKQYNNISIPAGRYECVKVVLGDGKGENWWCVAYPPLCFTESVMGELSKDGKTILKNSLKPEEYNILINEKTEFKIKFKLIEIIQMLKISNSLAN